MPKVFTILCHGTKFHRYEANEIVAEFGRNLSGREVRIAGAATNGQDHLTGDYLILEGPGSSSGQADAPTPGSVNPYTFDPKGDPSGSILVETNFGNYLVPDRTFADHFYGNGSAAVGTTRGLLTGAGWDDNVQRAVGVVANLNPMPERINLLGWSRGAVTTLKIANKLNEIFGNAIRQNIFAIDPVYGGLGVPTETDVTTIPASVHCIVVILSMHERRNMFGPQDLSRLHVQNPAATTAVFLPMPGGHSDQVRSPSTFSRERKHAAKVTWHLAWRFLTNFGTGFKQDFTLPLDVIEISNAYAQMRINMGEYRARGTEGLVNFAMGMGMSSRSMLDDLARYVTHSAYFVNEHHRAVFRQAFPNLYRTLFTNSGFGILAMAEFKREYDGIKTAEPTIVRSLMPYFLSRYLTIRQDPMWIFRPFATSGNAASLHRSWPAILPLS